MTVTYLADRRSMRTDPPAGPGLVSNEGRYVRLWDADHEAHCLSADERRELAGLRRARSDLIEWCEATNGTTAVVIRRILADAELHERLEAAGVRAHAIDLVLAGEEIAPGIRVVVDEQPATKDPT